MTPVPNDLEGLQKETRILSIELMTIHRERTIMPKQSKLATNDPFGSDNVLDNIHKESSAIENQSIVLNKKKEITFVKKIESNSIEFADGSAELNNAYGLNKSFFPVK